ncbi:hypothetical protein AB833_14945 [Chromatiales bacterium (ex Bugula neritina AB1)]|nr:hypothetical protein AB833_14945 [Chromatiales bacterium (ex Bugula neritina AB1)]
MESVPELAYLIANETRRLIPFRQAVVVRRKSNGKFCVEAISSLAVVDRTSPFVCLIESIMTRLSRSDSYTETDLFPISHYTDDDLGGVVEYPFQEALWLPFKNTAAGVFAGVLLLQEQRWEERYKLIGERLAGTYQHAWSALQPSVSGAVRRKFLSRKTALLFGALILAAMFLPVTMTTLAPVEIVASKPLVVAAPLQAVIEKILVEPNQQVNEGDLLFRFNDTDLRNRFRIASQDVQVASVKLRKAKQSVFSSPEQSHELSILKAELIRSRLALDYAKEQLDRVEVKATQSGIVQYSDRNDWVGKPVSIGEQVIRIADPQAIEFGVDVPVKDSIVLQSGARVRVYLDADPVTPIEATLTNASYHASELPGQQLAYRSRAALSQEKPESLRIGLRGTAKIYGEQVSLFFYLFRRPLSAARQFLGA